MKRGILFFLIGILFFSLLSAETTFFEGEIGYRDDFIMGEDQGQIVETESTELLEDPFIEEPSSGGGSYFPREEYLSFNDIRILCQRCHFAEEKGMVLCEYCNKKYYNPIYFMSCSDCKEKAQEEYRKFEEEIDRFEEKASF